MALFRLQIASIGRGQGRRATSAAAYRAGEKIRDERSGDVHNYSYRKDVLHTEIMLPSQLAGADMDWARDRSRLWNAAEQAENRSTPRVAREFQVSLPPEISAEQRLQLARAFSQELANRYTVAVDLAVHEPRAGGDPRNFHAHLLATTREVTPTGLGAKAGIDMSAVERSRRGLLHVSQEFVAVRERWATLTNEALREANVEARVDHRSLKAQGLDREPLPSIPLPAFRMEKAGLRSEVADRLRTEYHARLQRSLVHAPQQGGETEHGVKAEAAPSAPPKSLEEIRREAREAWLQMRGGLQAKTATNPERSEQAHPDHALDDDHFP